MTVQKQSILIALLWVLMTGIMFSVSQSHSVGAGDYAYYHRGAERILNGVPLYEGINPSLDYVGPPLIVQMVLPLAAVTDFRGSAAMWFFINLAAFFGSLVMLGTALESARARWVLWVAAAFFMPMFYSFWLGQVTPIMLLLTVGAWYSYRRGYPIVTGILLAVVVWTKFYPGLLILYFLWKREWRVVASAAIATVLVILFQMALVGFDGFISFFTEVLPPLLSEGQPALNHSNSSLLGFVQRLFAPAPQVILVTESPLLLSITRYGFTLLLLGSLLYLTAGRSMVRFDLEFSLTLLVAMLLGSTLGYHSLLSALLAMVVLVQSAGKSPTAIRRTALYTLLAYLLLNIHLFIMLGYLQPPSDNVLPALALSMPFFGMLLLWGMLMIAHQKRSLSTSVHPPAPEIARVEIRA